LPSAAARCSFARIRDRRIFSGEGDLSIKVRTAAIAVALLASGTLAASAQKTVLTCSSELTRCASLASQPRTCLLAKEQCMKTGRWVGPESGTDFGPRLKK
jgi:hypothetical protein